MTSSGQQPGAAGPEHERGVVPEYGYDDSTPRLSAAYIRPAVDTVLPDQASGRRVLDMGCGNGHNARWLSEKGWKVTGIDASQQGVTQARMAVPDGRFEVGEITEEFIASLNEEPFDLVISTEVVEHVYAPRIWARSAFAALRPGGMLICSTPYHGYLKNLMISLENGWDRHINPLWDGGHIKFWSPTTLRALLSEAGFGDFGFVGAGRLPYLWKSMVITARKPGAS